MKFDTDARFPVSPDQKQLSFSLEEWLSEEAYHSLAEQLVEFLYNAPYAADFYEGLVQAFGEQERKRWGRI